MSDLPKDAPGLEVDPMEPAKHEPDWAAIDALTDDDIARQIAANPDAAPEMGDVPLERWTAYRPGESVAPAPNAQLQGDDLT